MKNKQHRPRHANLKKEFLDVALETLDERGVKAVTMRELSKKIGVSRMAAYRHFANKTDLLCAVAEEGFRALAQRFTEVLEAAGPRGLDKLEAVGRAYLGFALENPALFRLMFGHELTGEDRVPSLEEAAAQAFGHFLQTVVLCQEEGSVRAETPLAVANLLWSMTHGLSCLLLDGQLMTAEQEEGFPTLLTGGKGGLPQGSGRIMDLMVEVLTQGLAPRENP